MSWQIFIISSLIASALATIGEKKAAKNSKLKAETSTVLYLLIGTGAIFLYILVSGQINIILHPGIIPSNIIIYIIIACLLYAIGDLASFNALQYIEVSKFSILLTLRTILTITLASLLLSESLTLLQSIGSILILTSIIVVFKPSKDIIFDKGEKLTILTILMYAFATIIDKISINTINIYLYLFIVWLLTSIFVFIIKYKSIVNDIKNINFIRLKELTPFAFLYAISSILFFEALTRNDNTSIISSVASSQVIITILLSFILLKETNDWQRKVVAAVMTFGGLVILAI